MKRLLRTFLLSVSVLLLPVSTAVGQVSDEALLNRTIERLVLKEANMHLILSYISAGYEVPIGLEVAQGGTDSPEIDLNFRRASLRKILDAIVAADSRYEWKVVDGVINVTPRSDRDTFLMNLLNTRVREFTVKNGTSLFDLRVQITNQTEIEQELSKASVTPSISAYTNADTVPVGKNFSLKMTDKTMRDILNEVIRSSETKYWIVNRDGPNGEYLILNF